MLYTQIMIMFKLWHFKVVKIGQNLHANMEGFCRASHIFPDATPLEPLFLKCSDLLSHAGTTRETTALPGSA